MAPPKWNELTPELQSQFLMGGKAKLADWYIDETNVTRSVVTEEEIKKLHKKASYRLPEPTYPTTDTWLYKVLDEYSIKGQTVAVMGSIKPWYEIVALEYGAFPTTVEYNLPNYNHPQIKEMLYKDCMNLSASFDAAFSISSFEHDGLGRYGDPIDPDADFKAMSVLRKVIKPGGLLFLAVPLGHEDKVVWNAHRIYGRFRMTEMVKDWEFIKALEIDYNVMKQVVTTGAYQPVFVLKNS